MLFSPKRLTGLVLGAALALAPAWAVHAQDVSEEADFLLWCGSAFYFLGILIEDETEAENFLAAGTALSDMGAERLIALGVSDEDIITTIEAYDERVLADFENDADLPFEAETCIAAFEP